MESSTNISTGKRSGRNIIIGVKLWARIFRIMKQSRRETKRNLAQPQHQESEEVGRNSGDTSEEDWLESGNCLDVGNNGSK